jgi:hypothetical protein
MARFLVGDTLGSIKSVLFAPAPAGAEPTAQVATLVDGAALPAGKGRAAAVQALAVDGPLVRLLLVYGMHTF